MTERNPNVGDEGHPNKRWGEIPSLIIHLKDHNANREWTLAATGRSLVPLVLLGVLVLVLGASIYWLTQN